LAQFPTDEWLKSLEEKINSDAQYAKIAQKWEADLMFVIEPGGVFKEKKSFYLDLWHGKCRQAIVQKEGQDMTAAIMLRSPYPNFVKILNGEWDPMQALMTRKLNVQGSMMLLMKNIPVVLDFVRCAREITDSYS
jgi:putative sterol carrier protein